VAAYTLAFAALALGAAMTPVGSSDRRDQGVSGRDARVPGRRLLLSSTLYPEVGGQGEMHLAATSAPAQSRQDHRMSLVSQLRQLTLRQRRVTHRILLRPLCDQAATVTSTRFSG
jgi:hypothetical protein